MENGNFGLWELAVLSFLRERPMHPYEIQRLLKARHKDDVLVLKRGSLYHAIRRLETARLIEALETTRNGRRPEHTTYRITPQGGRALKASLRTRIAEPQRERSDFLGTVSFLVHLTPQEAKAGLERRAGLLERQIADLDRSLAEALPRVGRIHLIESEYARAIWTAELAWVRGLADDLRARRVEWDADSLLRQAREAAK